MRLEGKRWSVALRAYTFPLNWLNVTEKNNVVTLLAFDLDGIEEDRTTLKLSVGRYRTPKQIIGEVNRLFRAAGVHTTVKVKL